jgi:hypothetical protein
MATMIERVGRRLRLTFQRRGPGATDADVPASSGGPAGGVHPVVEFVAYAEECVLSGRLRLATERLTDMLNEHDEILLVDVMVERFDGQDAVEVKEVLVERDEMVLVHASGPRGSQARRQRTRQHPVTVQLGRYRVHGYLHALPGSDPMTAIRRRKAMVPLTDAWIEYQAGPVRQRRRAGTVVINRDHVDVIAPGLEHEVDMPDLPVATEQGPLLKDFTGQILGKV